jgi:hypothetical protein
MRFPEIDSAPFADSRFRVASIIRAFNRFDWRPARSTIHSTGAAHDLQVQALRSWLP